MRKRLLSVFLPVALALTLLMLTAAMSLAAQNPPRNEIVIGIINPATGVLAGFGEGTPWTEELVTKFVNDQGGIYMKAYDKKLPVRLVIYDSESDTTKCSQLTQKLIQEDKVDLIVVRHTPETVVPVVTTADRFGVPCVSIDAPLDAWLSEGPYDWSWHAWWNLDNMFATYLSMWKTAGFKAGDKIGILFPNDADGAAWMSVFPEAIKEAGFTLVDPGRYPPMTQDFSNIISQFQREGVVLVTGMNTNPDFATFWRQARQMGYKPQFLSMGKAYLLESDALAVGADLMDGLTGEVWWAPTHPFKSSLTGETPASLAEVYKKATGRTITQPMGAKYAGMEMAFDALARAGSVDRDELAKAIAATDLQTIFGPIKFNEQHYSLTPLVGGQWQKNAQGGLDLVIFDNSQNPHLPTTGTYRPIKY